MNAAYLNPAARLTPPVRNRLLALVIGNLLMLGFILASVSGSDASFSDELARFAPNTAPQLLAGLALTCIIFTGAIDLSIGAILVMAGTVFGILYHYRVPPAACFAACFATAWALSIVNGLIIRLLRIPTIIVTLGGLTVYRGLAILLAEWSIPDFAGQISVQDAAYQSPGKEHALSILLMGLSIAVVWEACGKMPRTWLALGSSRDACRLKGLDPEVVMLSAYVAGGFFLGLASLVGVTNQLTIEPARMARNFELNVIGGVVLGGTNIFGGEGSFWGTILGGTFLYLVGQCMLYAGVSEVWRTALQGAVIIAVISADCVLHRRRKLLDELR